MDENSFSTASNYTWIYSFNKGGSITEPLVLKGLSNVWRSKAPSKIQFFGWRILLNRLATKLNSFRIDTNLGNSFRPLCFNTDETLFCLFYSCEVATSIWPHLCCWFGIDLLAENNSLVALFLYFKNLCNRKFKVKFHCCFWLAVCWVLWTSRNFILFDEGRLEDMDILGSLNPCLGSDFWLSIMG